MRHNGTTIVSKLLAGAAALAFAMAPAHAEDKAKQPTSIWEQDTLTGDWGGARTALKDKGIGITLISINEIMSVLSGGLHRAASYEGRFEFSVDTDLDKLVGWKAATTHFTIYQLHNAGHVAADNVGSIDDVSNIDALATTRLFTAWFQQTLFDDKVSIRVGQIAADDEFLNSPTAANMLNGTFGWASLVSANMLNGGPAFPLATPGVRVALKPTDQITWQTAVFSGNPAGADCNDQPQVCNRYGTTFSFTGGALWMSELQYAVNQEKNAKGLPGVYKLGGWYATTDFADQHYGLDGAGMVVSLANPAAVGPLFHRGDWGIYGIADQMVWRADKTSLNLFLRGGFAPSDRNLVSFYADGGFGVKGPFAGRADDVFTFGVSYAKISKNVAALDQDTLALNGPPYPIRDQEVVFEASYQAQIAPWWTVQPDLQYIVHPGGNVPDPNNPNMTVGNALIAGVRSTIKF
jgi:porin